LLTETPDSAHAAETTHHTQLADAMELTEQQSSWMTQII
jgi:hypothetical protein